MNRVIGSLVFLVVFAGVLVLMMPKPSEKKTALIPRKILFGPPEKFSPQISPDGTLVAYLAPLKGIPNVWLYDRRTKAERCVTSDKNRGILFFALAPDGRSLFYAQDQGGNENWHVFRIPLTGGDAVDLTPFDGVQAQMLVIDKRFPDQILITMNKEDRSRHDVYRLDLKSGALEIVAKNPGQISSWFADAEMKVRGAVSTNAAGGHDILVRKDERSDWQKIFTWDFEDDANSSVIGFSQSGKELYLIDSRGSDTARLVSLDLLTGNTKVLASDPSYDVGGVIMNPDDREIEMVSVYRERNELTAFRDSVREDLDRLKSIEKGDLFLTSRSYDDRTWIIGFVSDVSPLNYYIYDRNNKKTEFLFSHRPELKKYELSRMNPVSMVARDGLKLHGYLTLPKHGGKPFPMVLVVHGGPWTRDGWGFSPVCQWLADRGYACLQVNFRGSTGFGKKFVNAGNKEWGRKMQTDLEDAVTWAVGQGLADPKRMAIMGGSYGGYAALAAAAFTPNVFSCAIDLFGPSELITLINSMPPYWSVEKANILKRLGDPESEASLLKERSPLYYVNRIRIPMLIAQGANDPRTTRSQSDRIAAALRAKGIECEYLVFPDEGHGFVKPDNRLKFFMTAEAFFARHLAGTMRR